MVRLVAGFTEREDVGFNVVALLRSEDDVMAMDRPSTTSPTAAVSGKLAIPRTPVAGSGAGLEVGFIRALQFFSPFFSAR